MVQKKQENNTNTVGAGAGQTKNPADRIEEKMRDVAGAISAMEKAKIEKRKAEAYQLAQAIYTWVLSDSANTKGKAFIESHVTYKQSTRQSIAQGFGIAFGIGAYLALGQFITWALKFLHL